MKPHAIAVALAVSFALVACGEKSNSPIKTTDDAMRPGTTPTVSASAPPAPSDQTPPAPTPGTHAQAVQVPEAGAAPTARDTPAAGPTQTLTKAEEANSMPKPGQTDNHMTPSVDGELKGTQQSPGTAGPPAGAPAK